MSALPRFDGAPASVAIVAADLFCGGGGASEGIEQALGVPPYVAINHSAPAIAMHAANHPSTIHLCESVFDVDPDEAMGGRKLDLLWASPDCTHHSRAKGGKPRDKKIRGLAWVIVAWALSARPTVICCENVPEFITWGPLDENDQPIASRKGETFREFVGQLERLGYVVEWRVLNAADYGAPTSRKRLFLVARCDGTPIGWPSPTHGAGRIPYRTAAECIDWSIPCPSIFDRKKPLAEATQRRIAEGLRRYVLQSPRPYIVQTGHQSSDAGKVRSVDAPLSTIVAGGSKHALVAAFLAKHNGSGENWNAAIGQPLDEPVATVTGRDTKALVAASLLKLYGTSTGAPIDAPMPTITGQGNHIGLVAAFICKYYGQGGQWQGVDEPLHTIVSKARFGLVTITIDGEEWVVVDIGMRMLQPRELARAQGFDDSYILTGTKEQQTARIGNSVCPPVARAVVAAQFDRQPLRSAA